MLPNLKHLRAIQAVIQSGSVTDAASSLGISQPAVSMALRDCASAFGFPLFERKQGRLQPTSEAIALLPEIERIIDGAHRVEELAAGLRDINVGLVRIASTPSLADNLVPDAVAQIRSSSKAIDIALYTMINSEVVEQVSTGRVDFGLVLAPIDALDTRELDLLKSELVCVVARSHPLARLRTVAPKDLAAFPLISFNRNLPLGALISRAFQSKGVRRHIDIEVSQSSSARALARTGVGVAIVDSFHLLGNRERGLKHLKFTPTTVQTAKIILPRDGRVSRPARLLLGAIRESAARLSKDHLGSL
jgi:DNA-binding transcriptional LysR family regulator